jgi:hypothetical protein
MLTGIVCFVAGIAFHKAFPIIGDTVVAKAVAGFNSIKKAFVKKPS